MRKEAKTHGTGQLIEGPFRQGDVVAVIEDVITTGGSAIRAVQAVRAAGGTVASTPAVMNAIIDALWRSHRIRHLDMPATPRRIWEAIANVRKASN